MAGQWYKGRRRCVRCSLVVFLLYFAFLALCALTGVSRTHPPSEATSESNLRYQFHDQTTPAFMARVGLMKSAFLALASSALAAGQNASSDASGAMTGSPTTASVITATLDGTATTFSNAFTVPASADIGPNLLPNVQDPHAVQAQDVCPGYTASDVEKTSTGFTAILNLAGAPVGTRTDRAKLYKVLTKCSATSTDLTWRP